MKHTLKVGFTLIELLVVIAVVAIIGAGVAVSYGRETVENARRQMTFHEMGAIRTAFQTFHQANLRRIYQGIDDPETFERLPTATFLNTLDGPVHPATAGTADAHDRLYGMVEFYERYGLWALFRPDIIIAESGGARFEDIFSVYDPLSESGWNGPYLDAQNRVLCRRDVLEDRLVPAASGDLGALYPQVRTRFDDGFYRVLYFEHCEEEVTGAPVFRRLLLVAAESPAAFDELTAEELGRFSGNWRLGTGPAPLNPETGAIEQYDAAARLFFVELLNLDTTHP